mmetsp:Transcript_31977/g.70018  ORF Transcript_31977/g.70018 Transcript_31977/m.70018 type:complete len:448 (-) Transcript_31977:159-1502(-)|eukprot:CAMPEP_0204273122 /NCGR_PEP_ID=MMETSP0468-20130131/22621_1 /ASSEMBLY_ACC=CAM_ASM_000383 /TAXON_ID=2969 /ORGANISM="Oxyrrhis marina" /LENGTH=447 /DNA_ID=CAMNT_0051249075 /DNA_START=53 /DNA_END=1396 /DNA_ORIENTATION=+
MSRRSPLNDTAPGIRPAGWMEPFTGEGAKDAVQADILNPQPPTPRDLDRFRRPFEPGKINVHWAQVNDKIPAADFPYGIRTHKGQTVQTTIEAGRKEGIAEYLQQRGESIYESSKREPLGKSYSRGHELPGVVNESAFRFGIKQSQGEIGKQVLFPRGQGVDPPEVHERYVRTHGDYAPGEPVNRRYAWPVDPVKHRFGLGQEGVGLQAGKGVRDALTMDRDSNGAYPSTRVVPREAEDFRRVNNDELGKGRNMMQGRPPVPADFAYGVSTNDSGVTAAECVRGWYPQEEQLPDQDLGACLRVGRRNVTQETRPFGCPSIRHDIPKPRFRSVADTQNYGNEVGASALLNPQRFELAGIPDSDFLKRRPQGEVRDILSCAGYSFDDEQFQDIWNRAFNLFEDDQPLVSLDALLFIYSNDIDEDVAVRCNSLSAPLRGIGLSTRPISAK